MDAVRNVRMPRAERRAQLLGVAREVFAAQGYHAAAMEDIADRAGVSKPVLYQHFPGKLDLYLALLDGGIDSLIDSLEAAVLSTSDNKLRVNATMKTYFAFVDDPESAFRLVFEGDLTNDAAVKARVARVDDACIGLLSDVISADTGLNLEQANLLASGLLGMARFAALRWLRDEDRTVSRDDAADLVTTLAWRGIRSFPMSHPPEGREQTNVG